MTEREGNRDFIRMRWGLVPPWWPKPLKELRAATFNARVETVAEISDASRTGRVVADPVVGQNFTTAMGTRPASGMAENLYACLPIPDVAKSLPDGRI